jgi:hypothetical protein
MQIAVRPTLHLAPYAHTHFESHTEWRKEAEARGHVISSPDVLPNSQLGSTFLFEVAYSNTGSGKVLGACFLNGINFGWLRT